MTDGHPDDGPGDGPDSIDDRLTAIRRLIDTAGNDHDPERRHQRRVVAFGLLAQLGMDVLAVVALEMDRLDW
jgi:hypothetical protein